MLYHVFLIFVIFHFVFVVLGLMTRKGGYILLALVLVFSAMVISNYMIQYPYVPIPGGQVNETTKLQIAWVRDPITALLLLPWVFIDVLLYGTLTKWGKAFNKAGWF